MARKICFEATIQVDFETDCEIENDDDMWEEIGAVADNICLLVKDQNRSVKYINISDYSEGYMQD